MSLGSAPGRLIFSGLLMVYASLVLAYGPVPSPGQPYIWPKDSTHWVGWAAAIAIWAAMTLPLIGVKPGRNLHCALGLGGTAGSLYHISVRLNPFTGTPIGFWIITPADYAGVFIVALTFFVAANGTVRRFAPSSSYTHRYGKALHYPVSLALGLMLVYHTLVKMGLL